MFVCRWKTPDGKRLKYPVFIPNISAQKSVNDDDNDDENLKSGPASKRETEKGALYHEYDWQTHQFVTHLRRVHSSNPPIQMKVGQTMVNVKAADPLAPPGVPLYYFHSKTDLYNNFFFEFWDECMVPTFQFVCPWLKVDSMAALDKLFTISVDR